MVVSTFYDNVPHPQDENRIIQQTKYRSSATGDKVYNTRAEAQAQERAQAKVCRNTSLTPLRHQ